MKRLITIVACSLLTAVQVPTAQANFFGGDNGFFGNNNNGEWKMGPNGYYWDESNWPEWTPMYWMEEFMDSWDDNGNGFGGFGNNSFGNNNYGGYSPMYPMPMQPDYGYQGGAPYNAYPAMPYPYGGGYAYPAMPYGGYNYANPGLQPQAPTTPSQ